MDVTAAQRVEDKPQDTIQEENYENVTAAQQQGEDKPLQKQENYENVSAAHRWGEGYGYPEVAYNVVSCSHAPDTPLYDAVYHS